MLLIMSTPNERQRRGPKTHESKGLPTKSKRLCLRLTEEIASWLSSHGGARFAYRLIERAKTDEENRT